MHTSVIQRLRNERLARQAQYIQDLTVLIYKRVDGLSFSDSGNYAALFAEALTMKRCIASRQRPELQTDFVHIPVCDNVVGYDQSVKLLLLLEELLETQMTVTKKIDTVNQMIDFVVIEPIGSGLLARDIDRISA